MFRYVDYLIYIVTNINGNIEIRDKITEKLRGLTNKIIHISAANCPRVAHLVSY